MPSEFRGMAMTGAHLASQSMGQGNNPNMMPPNAGQQGGGMHPEMMMNMGMMAGGMQGGMPNMHANMPQNMGPGGDLNPVGGQAMMMPNMGGDEGQGQMTGMEYSGSMGMDYTQVSYRLSLQSRY